MIDKVYKQKNLALAWDKVRRNKGAGGIDGQSITEFESNSGEYLARVHDEKLNYRKSYINLLSLLVNDSQIRISE